MGMVMTWLDRGCFASDSSRTRVSGGGDICEVWAESFSLVGAAALFFLGLTGVWITSAIAML